MVSTKLASTLIILLITFLSLSHEGLTQPSIDSLKIELSKSSGESRVSILNELSRRLKHIEPENALEYANEAARIANLLSFKEAEASAYINSGNVYRKLGNFNRAVESFLMALQISQESKYGNGIARSFNGLGIAYNLLGEYDKSLESFLNSLKSYELNEDIIGTADALNNVGIHYLSLGDLDEALDYYLRALEMRREIGEIEDIAASLNNIGDIYADLGKTDSALQYFLEALKLQEENENNDVIFALQINIGLLYGDLKDHAKAMEHFRKGLEIAEKIGDNWGMAMTYNYMGMTQSNSGYYTDAEQYLNQSLNLAQKIGAKAVVRDVYKSFAELSLAKNDYKRSLEHYKHYTELKDSIFNETTSQQIAEMQTRYETEKKVAEINELKIESTVQELKLNKSENLKWFFIVASSLIFLLAGVIFYGFRQKQKANQLLVERNKLEVENKNRAISLFGQQVSKEVALELLSDTFKSSSMKLFACIMFLDIRDFTPFAEKKEPFEIIQYQNDVFGFMIDIVSKHHGIINQFLGDGFMATFGAPASSGNDCQNAVNASLEIVELLDKKCYSGEIPKTKVGIGLHAGFIVTGNVGTSERKQYSITGNTVILASRIEQLNKKFDSTILISNEVLDKLDQTKLKISNLGAEYVKGRVEPLEIVRLA